MGTILVVVCGCGDSYEHVTYDPAPLAGPFQEIGIPDVQEDESNENVAQIRVDEPVSRGAALAFQGRFQASAGAPPPVLVIFYAAAADGARTSLNSGFGEWEEGGDGWFKYRIEICAPQVVGRCEVEVRTLDSTIARGEVDVQ